VMTVEGEKHMLKEKPSINIDELLTRAKKPSADAMSLHPFYRGKIEIIPKCAIRDFNDFAIWYTPGVAAPCRAIAEDPEKVYDYTNKWNTVIVVSDGTRVLGLGDIGPKAGLPVMEGKALLYKYLGGIDSFPIMLGTKDPDAIIQAVLMLQPGVGGSTWRIFPNLSVFASWTHCERKPIFRYGMTTSRAPQRSHWRAW